MTLDKDLPAKFGERETTSIHIRRSDEGTQKSLKKPTKVMNYNSLPSFLCLTGEPFIHGSG